MIKKTAVKLLCFEQFRAKTLHKLVFYFNI